RESAPARGATAWSWPFLPVPLRSAESLARGRRRRLLRVGGRLLLAGGRLLRRLLHLDLGAATQPLHFLVDDPAGHLLAQLGLDLLEARRRLLAPVLNQDDVPAELGLDRRLAVVAGPHLEGGLGEGL